MRNDINSYINAIVKDNKQSLAESGLSSVAQYIIASAESANSWHEFFDDKELEGDPTEEQIAELKDYLLKEWDDIVTCQHYYTLDGKEVFLADSCMMPEDIKPVQEESVSAYELKYWFDYLENNGLSAQEANAHPNMTYFESYAGGYADNGAEIVFARVLNAENEEHYLYDWILVADLEDVNEELKAHGFQENEMPDPTLQVIKAYELSMSGESVDYKITSVVELKDGAKLHLFEGAGIESSAISYADGTTFVLTDWQGSRPETEEEIADYDWVSATDGRKAIVMDGLPRLF